MEETEILKKRKEGFRAFLIRTGDVRWNAEKSILLRVLDNLHISSVPITIYIYIKLEKQVSLSNSNVYYWNGTNQNRYDIIIKESAHGKFVKLS